MNFFKKLCPEGYEHFEKCWSRYCFYIALQNHGSSEGSFHRKHIWCGLGHRCFYPSFHNSKCFSEVDSRRLYHLSISSNLHRNSGAKIGGGGEAFCLQSVGPSPFWYWSDLRTWYDFQPSTCLVVCSWLCRRCGKIPANN